MGILLCEQNFRDVWNRNESGRAEIGQILHTDTHTHTTAAKLVLRINLTFHDLFTIVEIYIWDLSVCSYLERWVHDLLLANVLFSFQLCATKLAASIRMVSTLKSMSGGV